MAAIDGINTHCRHGRRIGHYCQSCGEVDKFYQHIAELEAKVERLEKDIQDAFLRNCRPDDGRGFAGSPRGYEV